jgi:hypothetical protein
MLILQACLVHGENLSTAFVQSLVVGYTIGCRGAARAPSDLNRFATRRCLIYCKPCLFPATDARETYG